MGDLLVKIFDIVTEHGGYEARLKMAEKTGISRSKATEIDDSPEIVEKLKKVASEILGKDINELLK